MATSNLISPMSGHAQFDYFCFDPQIDYAQVLGEAQRIQDGEEEESLSHLKNPLDQLHKPLEELKKKKSWKSSLFFWRAASSEKKQMNMSKAIPALKSRGKPIYMNDIVPSSRSGRSSTSLAAMFNAMQKSKVDVPYLPVVYRSHSHRRVSLSRPIYLVT